MIYKNTFLNFPFLKYLLTTRKYFYFVFISPLSKIINNGKRPICFSLRELASLPLGRLGLAFHFAAAT